MVLFNDSFAKFVPELENDYADGDVLFSPIEIALASGGENSLLRRSNPLEYVGITWGVSDAPSFVLMFFDIAPTSFGDTNAAVNVSFDDLKNRIGTLEIDSSEYYTVNGSQILDITGDDLGIIRTTKSSGSIWIAGIISGSYSSNLEDNLQIGLGIKVASNI